MVIAAISHIAMQYSLLILPFSTNIQIGVSEYNIETKIISNMKVACATPECIRFLRKSMDPSYEERSHLEVEEEARRRMQMIRTEEERRAAESYRAANEAAAKKEAERRRAAESYRAANEAAAKKEAERKKALTVEIISPAGP